MKGGGLRAGRLVIATATADHCCRSWRGWLGESLPVLCNAALRWPEDAPDLGAAPLRTPLPGEVVQQDGCVPAQLPLLQQLLIQWSRSVDSRPAGGGERGSDGRRGHEEAE